VWLGLTANCCVCHDHKFDPIPTRDFYSMSAFFRNTTQSSHDGNIKESKPIVFLPRMDESPRYAMLPNEIAKARQALQQRKIAAQSVIAPWLKTVKPEDLNINASQLVLAAAFSEASGGATKIQWTHDQVVSQLKVPLAKSGQLEWRTDAQPGPAVVLPKDNVLELSDAGDFEWKQPFSISLWVRPADKRLEGVLVARGRTSGMEPGWGLYVQEGSRVVFTLAASKTGQSIRAVSPAAVVRPEKWTHVAAVYDGSGTARGLQLYVNGAALEINRSGTGVESSIRSKSPLTIGRRLNNENSFAGAALSDLRVYARPLNSGEVGILAQLPALKADAAMPADKRKTERLANYYLDRLDLPYEEATRKLQQLERELRTIEAHATVTHVQEEKMNSMAMANILTRGQYDKPADKVTPAVFSALNPLPANAPRNRLGLARWLVDAENPLTARVTVNRYWQELFGVGIVKTAEDFGIMGEPPSHTELLDWLAMEFRENGWNVKQMFRLLVTSATYRQAAVSTPEKLAKDRDNRLLSRGPRFRMDAEMIRDYFLAASGSLSSRMGGPGTKPYQPEGIWEIVGLPGGNTREYHQDKGEGLYRRSLYTFWKRMAPPPNMETFNAPSRETSCLRRDRPNTPLQALVTLNDPQFVEASRNLAQKVLKESEGADVRTTLNAAAHRILCRPLRATELVVLEPTVVELLNFYRAHSSEARALIVVGESRPDDKLNPATLAAWTNVCNVLFNMDEVLNK
jgi:hypothetical protein